MITSPPQSILIIKLSAIGDIVMSMPVASLLRKRYPKANIIWLTQPENAPLLEANQDIDGVVLFDKKAWQAATKRSAAAVYHASQALKAELHSYQFDLALDLQGLLKSGYLAWLSGAKQRIGLGSREGSQLLMHRVIARGGDNSLISSEYRFFSEKIGLGDEPFRLDLAPHLSNHHRQNAQSVLDENGINQPFVALCPFTTRPQKHWRNEYWPTLINHIVQTHGYPVVIVGGPNDHDDAQLLIQKTTDQARCANLCGQTRLLEAAAVLEQADLVIGVDTGLTHMATALRRPTLAIFGSTLPYTHTDNPYSAVAYSNRSCSPCRRNPTCQGYFDCMWDLSPELIERQAFDLLALYQGDQP